MRFNNNRPAAERAERETVAGLLDNKDWVSPRPGQDKGFGEKVTQQVRGAAVGHAAVGHAPVGHPPPLAAAIEIATFCSQLPADRTLVVLSPTKQAAKLAKAKVPWARTRKYGALGLQYAVYLLAALAVLSWLKRLAVRLRLPNLLRMLPR
eukprot:SAG22_NODE_2095_length_3020_cov_2.379664_3_plen_151_part_00